MDKQRKGKRKRTEIVPETKSLLGFLLESLPTRDNTLCQHSFVSQLDTSVLKQLRAYLVDSFPGSPEVATALLDHVAMKQPKHLRTKELIETVEVVKRAGSEINHLLSKAGQVSGIYDLACGHGLAGVLMAYRFPKLQVVCIDRTRRPCFDSYLAAFKEHGEGPSLEKNLKFVEGDITPSSAAGQSLPPQTFVLCIHGCNEMSTTAAELARRANGAYTIMPCCIRDDVFGVRTHSAFKRWHMDDSTRYSVQVGYLAGKLGARKVCTIDRRITNRHLGIVGAF